MQEFSVDPHRLTELLEYCMDFAKMMLGKCGEFHPFGAVIQANDSFGAVGAYTGENFPHGQELFQLLLDSFKQQFQKGEIKAAAIAANVNIPKEFEPSYPDGIRVWIECAGYSRMVYIPYSIAERSLFERLTRRKRRVTYGEMIPVDVDPFMAV